MDSRKLTMSMPWNLFLLTLGGFIAALALKCIAIPHGFISGGLFGTGLLVYYVSDSLTPAIWYALINVPVFILAWRLVGRRFFFYTLYGFVINTLAVQFIPWVFPVENTLLAAITSGSLYGIGLAIMLRSFGSDGGLTIIGVILNQRFDIKLGAFSFIFNVGLFSAAFLDLPVDHVLYSMVLVYVQTAIIDSSMSMMSQRKLALIISGHTENIAQLVMTRLKRGCTFIPARGAYTNTERSILLTVVYNFQLKRLEELVYEVDPKAFLIVENTYDVIGEGFSSLKRY